MVIDCDMCPLTTLTPDTHIGNTVDFNDAVSHRLQNPKTVECKLKETYKRLAETEANIYVFKTLLSLNLATNDITNFVKKQTIHKRVIVRPDLRVQKTAMKSKIADAIAFAGRLRKLRDSLKKKVSRKYADRKSKGRRVLESLLKVYRQFKESEIEDAKSKIDHIVNKEKIQKSLKVAPSGTESLLSGVNVFSKDQQKVKPEDLAPPFICHKDIKLYKNELKVLSRGPKFMVREEIDEELFEVEMEKMIAKKKYDSAFNVKIEDDCAVTAVACEHPNQFEGKPESRTAAEMEGKNIKGFGPNASKNEILWEENCPKMVYNLKNKSLDFGNMQATMYKYNKRIFTPEPECPENEISHELRRTEMRRIFERAHKQTNDNGQGNVVNVPRSINNISPKGSSSQSNGKSNPFVQSESNLSKEEQLGLISLKKELPEAK